MALTGTLADVRLDELASLLQQQARTGLLRLTLERGDIAIGFRDGLITQVDHDKRPATRLLGELLIEGGCIERTDLAMALEVQRKDDKPLGTILVGMGVLANADLHKYLDLQFKETLYPLFEVTAGSFEFDASGYPPRTLAPPPLAIEALLMEAARRIDELPDIQVWIPGPQARVFRTTDELHLGGNDPLTSHLGQRERAVFYAIEGRARPESLVGRTGLDTFEVMKALSQLVQAGKVDLVGRTTTGTGGFTPVRADSFWQRRATVLRPALQLLLNIALVATLGLLALNIYLDRFWTPEEGELHAVSRTYSPLRALQTTAQLDRLRNAVEIFHLAEGGYPASLATLVDFQLIATGDLTYPDYAEEYHYEPMVEGFTLLPPKR